MAKPENQPVVSSRDRIMGMMQEQFPNRRFAAPGAPGAPDAQESYDDLDDSIVEYLEQLRTSNAEHEARNKRMLDIYAGNPMNAEIINTMAETGSAMGALVKMFGYDKVREAFDSEEVREEFVKYNEDYLEKVNADRAGKEQRAANWDASLEALDQFGNEMGLDEQGKVQLFEKVYDAVVDGIALKFSRETFQAAYNAMNYDKDVESARQDGEVAGRNSKIEERRVARKVGSDGIPPQLGGQGVQVPERKPESKKPYNIWDEI